MGYEDHRQAAPSQVKAAVLIISDSRDAKSDESGKALTEGLIAAGHHVAAFAFLKNDASAIREKVQELLSREDVQVIVTSGGTGASARDITVETLTPLFAKTLPGFGELFRLLTYQQIGSGAILSRAVAGVVHAKVIMCLPGSLKAVQLALEKIIIPEIAHLVREAGR